MKYKCIVRDSLDLWLTESKTYDGEPVIPPLTPNEAWIKLYSGDDGHPVYVRAKQMQRVFDESSGLDDLSV